MQKTRTSMPNRKEHYHYKKMPLFEASQFLNKITHKTLKYLMKYSFFYHLLLIVTIKCDRRTKKGTEGFQKVSRKS